MFGGLWQGVKVSEEKEECATSKVRLLPLAYNRFTFCRMNSTCQIHRELSFATTTPKLLHCLGCLWIFKQNLYSLENILLDYQL
jgi:hypothetical protein